MRLHYSASILVLAAAGVPLTWQTPDSSAPAANPHSVVQAGVSAKRDVAAVLVLNQSQEHSGGFAHLEALLDFRAVGNITYHWSEQKETNGTISIEGKGTDQLRFESKTNEGTSTWIVNGRTGQRKSWDGVVSAIPYHNLFSLGAFTLPQLRMHSAARNMTTDVEDLGVKEVDGLKLRSVRIRPRLPSPEKTNDDLSDSAAAEYLIDPTSGEVRIVRDFTHPVNNASMKISRVFRFSDYRDVAGLRLPFQIDEEINGQKVFSIAITNLDLNVGLSDADFAL